MSPFDSNLRSVSIIRHGLGFRSQDKSLASPLSGARVYSATSLRQETVENVYLKTRPGFRLVTISVDVTRSNSTKKSFVRFFWNSTLPKRKERGSVQLQIVKPSEHAISRFSLPISDAKITSIVVSAEPGYSVDAMKIEYRKELNLNKPADLIKWKQSFGINISIENAKFLLENVYTELEKLKKSPTLAFGTLLGAFRDQEFISHDTDVDIMILDTDLLSKISLENVNFFWFWRLSHRLKKRGIFLVRDIQGLKSFWYKTDYIDLYIFKQARETATWKLFKFNLSRDEIGDFSWIDFYGRKYRAPENIALYLERRYGTDWRVPKIGRHATQ